MNIKKILTTLSVVTMLIVCSACKPSTPKISVTVYPVEYLVERIGGDYVEVKNISKGGTIQTASIIDDFQKQLENSKVLFYIQELEPYFDVYSSDIRASKIDMVDLASKSVFYKFQRYTTTENNGQISVVESPYYDGDSFTNIDMYKDEPMIWMDPISMISSAEIIRDYLIEQYPEYQEVFHLNYDELEMDLTRLDVEYQKLRKAPNPIAFVSMTPSYGAWQKSYGIRVYPVCLSKFGALPSKQQLAIMKEKIVNDGVKYIVHEDNLNADMEDMYQSLKAELGLKEVKLSNVSSLNIKETKENRDYLTIMYDNLTALESIMNNLE